MSVFRIYSILYSHFALDIGYWFRDLESLAAAIEQGWWRVNLFQDFYIFSNHNCSLLSSKSRIKSLICKSWKKTTESEDYPSTGLFWWAASSVLDTGLDPSALLQDQTTTEVKAELVTPDRFLLLPPTRTVIRPQTRQLFILTRSGGLYLSL